MRFFQYLALSALLCLAGASSAWGYAFEMTTPYAGETLSVGDQVTADVFLDVSPGDPGATILAVAILFDDVELDYNRTKSEALTPSGPGTSGAQPSYILYDTAGMGTILYPSQTPSFQGFPAMDSPQININYVEAAFGIATATGTGIYLASVVLDVVAEGDGTAEIELTLEPNSVLIQSGTIVIDSSTVGITGAIITVTVPEPAVAGLALASLATLAAMSLRAYRRRPQR